MAVTLSVGAPTVLVTAVTCGEASALPGAVTLTLYSTASVADGVSTTSVVAFTGIVPLSVAQDILSNLDAAILATAKG